MPMISVYNTEDETWSKYSEILSFHRLGRENESVQKRDSLNMLPDLKEQFI